METAGTETPRSGGLILPLSLLLVVLAAFAALMIWLNVESSRLKSGAAIGASTGLEFDRPQETNALASIPLSKPIASAPPEPEPQAKPESELGPESVDSPAEPAEAPPVVIFPEPPAVAPERLASAPGPATPPVVASRPLNREPVRLSKPPALPPRFRLPRRAVGPPLSVAPDPELIQRTSLGPLPTISGDGRKPWKVYARPFDRSDKRPRVSIVVTALGLSSAATEAAIQGLPGPVTLAFAPYSRRLSEWIELARAAGHEVLINVPMEPVNFPAFDPGPHTLLTTLSDKENRDRLFWSLTRGTGYVGVADFMGSKFTMSRSSLGPVLAALNDRGLLFLDSGSAPRSVAREVARDLGIPFASGAQFVDEWASREAIDGRLAELVKLAESQGSALGIASPYPVSLERIASWSSKLENAGIALAPVSAVAAGLDGR